MPATVLVVSTAPHETTPGAGTASAALTGYYYARLFFT